MPETRNKPLQEIDEAFKKTAGGDVAQLWGKLQSKNTRKSTTSSAREQELGANPRASRDIGTELGLMRPIPLN
jgi:hypothetical protein